MQCLNMVYSTGIYCNRERQHSVLIWHA